MLFLLFKRQGEWYPINLTEQITGKQSVKMVPHKSAGANYREAKHQNGTP